MDGNTDKRSPENEALDSEDGNGSHEQTTGHSLPGQFFLGKGQIDFEMPRILMLKPLR